MAVESTRREQVNISVPKESALALKLREAERITGQPRSQIARAVLDAFLETWLQVEETRIQMVGAVKEAALAKRPITVVVRDLGEQLPPYRGDEYRPEPDYWKVVEARRPVPPEIVATYHNVPVGPTIEQSSPVRTVDPDWAFFEDVDDADA